MFFIGAYSEKDRVGYIFSVLLEPEFIHFVFVDT